MEMVGQTAITEKSMVSQATSSKESFMPLLSRASQETSLSFLTRRFKEVLSRSVDGVLDLNVFSQEVGVSKRRAYDITNVLEGISLIKKKSKNHIQWLGRPLHGEASGDHTMLIEEEKKLDKLIQSCAQEMSNLCEERYIRRYAFLTYEDIRKIPSLKEQTVIVIKAPAGTKVQVPHPEESFQVHIRSTNGPVEVFLCSDKPIPEESTAVSSVSDSLLNPATYKNDFFLPLDALSSLLATSKEDANSSCGMNGASHQSELTSLATVTPVHTSLQSPSEDGHNYSTSPLAFSLDGKDYLPSLAEDEGITDLFSV